MATLPTDLLLNFSEEALLDELERRKKASMPQPQNEFSYDPIIKACRDCIEYLASDDFSEDGLDDYEHDIFETALESVYGSDVWEWWNRRLQEE